MSRVAIGKYLERTSLIHSFNPLLKFILVIVCFVFMGIGWNFEKLFFYSSFTVLVIFASKITLKEILLLLKPFKFLLLFMFIFQYLGLISSFIDIYALKIAFLNFGKFLILIVLSGVFTITTKSFDLVASLKYILKPLEIFGFNASKFSLCSLIAIRFVPFFQRESLKTIKELKKSKTIGNKKSDIVLNIDKLIFPVFEKAFAYSDRIDSYLKRHKVNESIFKLPVITKKDYFTFMAGIILLFAGVMFV